MEAKLSDRKLKRMTSMTPSQVLVTFFFLLITGGALLLTLPAATVTRGSIGFLNALFTSTSSVCVTGLVVVDTGTTFTLFGQIVIMLLIQFGGLGIMTAASVIYVFLRRKMSVANMLVMREALNQDSMSYLAQTVASIIKMTILIECIGALLLSFRFIPMFGAAKGMFFSVFHAVSAFCNAGFDLNGNFSSITAFVGDPLVVLTISGLIVLGGTGFAVIHEITTFKKNKKLSLQARVVVGMTLFLIVMGTVGFLLLEIMNPQTLGNPDMPWGTKILAALFQSVTTRTAGFNTIDQAALTMPSKLLSMVLMFIGASPASTGGGIKTTTACIMMMTCFSIIKGNDDIQFKYRRVSIETAIKAFTTAVISLVLVLLCAGLIMVFEQGLTFDAVTFEAFSAFGTVGLSTGITAGLSSASRIILIATMFAGRVGPLTLTMALVGTRKKKHLTKNVESGIMIG